MAVAALINAPVQRLVSSLVTTVLPSLSPAPPSDSLVYFIPIFSTSKNMSPVHYHLSGSNNHESSQISGGSWGGWRRHQDAAALAGECIRLTNNGHSSTDPPEISIKVFGCFRFLARHGCLIDRHFSDIRICPQTTCRKQYIFFFFCFFIFFFFFFLPKK